VVVDKLNHRVHLVRGGRTIRSYAAEFGPNWMDRKVREGDEATPEGRYRVIRKKSRGQTRFYKALLLDYPNEQDSARFRRLVAEEVLPRYSRIGGLIEIHGDGGKGEDWTLGCVSLRNEDIDELYPQLRVGTLVTIVGLWDEPSWLTRFLETADR
jgi:murein L,D-transpeptidase YafK